MAAPNADAVESGARGPREARGSVTSCWGRGSLRPGVQAPMQEEARGDQPGAWVAAVRSGYADPRRDGRDCARIALRALFWRGTADLPRLACRLQRQAT